ncbi:MAG: metallophosphoesterase [Thermoplasmata archaeon]|nr:metallophosphoesterase [Thermoplasmata archaeon]
MVKSRADLRPIGGAAALLWSTSRGRRILVSDLHLGLGDPRGRGTGLAERGAREMLEELLELARRERALGVVVAGDLKHPIVGAPGRVGPLIFEFCAGLLASGLSVDVVPGNHDVGLAPHLPREVELHSAGGLLRDGVGIFHGHRWPDRTLERAEVLVAGHLHPGYRFAPGSGGEPGKLRCWVRAELGPELPGFPPQGKRRARAKELLILPAFNALSGIESLNRSAPSRGRSFLVHRFLGSSQPRAYLLDGTNLGALPMGPTLVPGARARSGPGP